MAEFTIKVVVAGVLFGGGVITPSWGQSLSRQFDG